MPLRSWSDIIDEEYPPGSIERRRFDAYSVRVGRIDRLCTWVYRMLYRIPPRWVTWRDEEYGNHTYRGVGPVVAQFWHDILSQTLHVMDGLDHASPGDVFYNALDGLAWRFFDDEYVPTWTDVKSGKSGRTRLIWRLRRRHAIEQAEAMAEDYLRETGAVDK